MNTNIIFGTWQLPTAQHICRDAVSAALQAGYRQIDTAADYDNEESVGQAIRQSGLPRKEITLITKLSANIKDPRKAELAVEESLSRLDTQYIDLLLIHAPRPWGDPFYRHYTKENQEIWQMLEQKTLQGSIRHIGLSNFNVSEVDDILQIARIHPAANQIKCHIGNYPATLAHHCSAHSIPLMGFSTLSTRDLLERPELQQFARKYGVTVPQLCIQFSLSHGFMPIVQSRNPLHIAQNLEADFTITEADLQALRTLPGLVSHRFGDPQPYENR